MALAFGAAALAVEDRKIPATEQAAAVQLPPARMCEAAACQVNS